MNWSQARRLLGLREAEGAGAAPGTLTEPGPDPLVSIRATSLCVVSGKGGTGKSTVCASLAQLLARQGRTLLLDADLGVANAHILQDAHPERCLVDAIEGRCQVRDVVHACGTQLDLLAGGSGFARVAGLTSAELQLLAAGVERLERQYRFLLVDSAAGLSQQTVSIAAAADRVLLVTTPDVTAMTDAYAFLKVLWRTGVEQVPFLVVNRATSEEEARHAAERIEAVCHKFLGMAPVWIGHLPEDRAAFRAAQRRTPVVAGEPDAPLAEALSALAHGLVEELGRAHPRGLGRVLLHHARTGSRTA